MPTAAQWGSIPILKSSWPLMVGVLVVTPPAAWQALHSGDTSTQAFCGPSQENFWLF